MIKNEIGILAGHIWQLLDKKKSLSIREIGELTKEKESSIFMSVGWLARENKVMLKKDDKGKLKVELVHFSNEIYY